MIVVVIWKQAGMEGEALAWAMVAAGKSVAADLVWEKVEEGEEEEEDAEVEGEEEAEEGEAVMEVEEKDEAEGGAWVLVMETMGLGLVLVKILVVVEPQQWAPPTPMSRQGQQAIACLPAFCSNVLSTSEKR